VILSVPVDADLLSRIEAYRDAYKMSKADVARQALLEFFDRRDNHRSPEKVRADPVDAQPVGAR
jgi:hypothetical protein